MISRLCAVALAAALPLALGACGEKPKVYTPAVYSGKPDSKPWDNEQFKGDQAAWEKAVKARTQGQNEYSRSVVSTQ